MNLPRTIRTSVLVLIATVLLIACGGSGDGTAASAESAVAADLARTAPSNPLRGEFPTLDGSSIDLGSLQGQDVVLWFWAPW